MSSSVTRREFIHYSFSAGALLVSAPMLSALAGNHSEGEVNSVARLSPLLKIYQDNSMTFYYPSPEMGQGVDTSLAMLFMEELGGDMDLVSVKPMPYQITRDDEGKVIPVSVPQFSGGSTSISRNYPLLRQAGAGIRQLVLQAAAKRSNQDFGSLKVSQSFVTGGRGLKMSLGSLVELASKETLPDGFEPVLQIRENWKTIGKRRSSTQVHEIVTGQPLYGMDRDYPDAKVALMTRSPFLDGDVKSLDARAALALPGVHAVIQLEMPELEKYYTYLAAGVAVLADDFWTAKKARDLLKIEWHQGPHTEESSESLANQCDELLKSTGQIVKDDGDFEQAVKQAKKLVKRRYKLPLVSHAQLEPQNCIAHVQDDKCKIIGPMQSPGGASRLAAEITGLDRLDIDIEYTRLGGGFGRRLNSDHVAEAVAISKISGMPVKLIWTREDDMAHDFYRPMGHHEVIATIDENDEISGWAHRLAGTPKHYRRNGKKPEELFGADMYVDDFPAGLVTSLRNEYFPAKSGAPQGSWRAPAHTANAFVIQSFLDELAEEIGQDPLQLRLSMLGEPKQFEYGQHGGPTYDTGRMTGVLSKVAAMAKWGKDMPAMHAQGVAGHFTFGGYCAQIAEVELVSDRQYKVNKVFCAIDVGTVINPEGVIAQVEGGINDGLSTAAGQQVLIEGGQIMTENFDTYKMMRIGQSVTEIEVQVINSKAEPAGAGEMGLPPLAPAVANAIRLAGGKRLRSQPFSLEMSLV